MLGSSAAGSIEPGTRVRLSGGYDYEPRWLGGEAEYHGTVERFIPGQNREAAAVVRLDRPITVEGVTGAVLVLELRYQGARWTANGTVHLELCDFEPDAAPWSSRRQGIWIESNATYERLGH